MAICRALVVAILVVSGVTGCDKRAPAPSAGGGTATGGTSVPTNNAAKPSVAAKTQGWKPIAGGKEHRFAGVVAHVPASWTIAPHGNGAYLVPTGANQAVIEELYGFMGEPTLKTIDAPELDAYLDQALMQMLGVPVQRSGSPEALKVGELDGRMWKWTATSIDGRPFEIRSWGFVGSYAASLVAIATPEAMKRREADLAAIRSSIHRPAAAAIDASRLIGTWVRAFGSGSVLIGNANEQRITFDGAGRFHYHSEGTSHGLFHTGSSQTDVYGSWKLVGDQLTGVADTGETATFTLEARTEAQAGAAVIAIDGTEFRQAEGRPW